MTSTFCCSFWKPSEFKVFNHETKFAVFLEWCTSVVTIAFEAGAGGASTLLHDPWTYAIQVVRQITEKDIETRYFAIVDGKDTPGSFREVTEDDLTQANFKRLDPFQTLSCVAHNQSFILSVYQRETVYKHHWRASRASFSELTRPAALLEIAQHNSLEKLIPSNVVLSGTTPSPKHRKDSAISLSNDRAEFGSDTALGTIALALPSLAINFNGDLLSLVILDAIASKQKLQIKLDSAWSKLLSPLEIACFIFDCAKGYELTLPIQSKSIVGALEPLIALCMMISNHPLHRSRLEDILGRMKEYLGPTNRDCEEVQRERARMLAVIGKALDVVIEGPSSEFRIDLSRSGIAEEQLPQIKEERPGFTRTISGTVQQHLEDGDKYSYLWQNDQSDEEYFIYDDCYNDDDYLSGSSGRVWEGQGLCGAQY